MFIYLASPYSHPEKAIQQLRYELTEEVVAGMLKEGLHVYSPIVHCHNLALKYKLPGDAKFWQDYNFTMLKDAGSFYILTLLGWEDSEGIAAEARYWHKLSCEKNNKVSPVTSYLSPSKYLIGK